MADTEEPEKPTSSTDTDSIPASPAEDEVTASSEVEASEAAAASSGDAASGSAEPVVTAASVDTQESRPSTMQTRIRLGGIMLATILGLLCADHFIEHSYFFILLLTTATTIGLIEFYRMAKQSGSRPWWFIGSLFGIAMLIGQWTFLEYEMSPILQSEGATMFLMLFLITIMAVNVLLPERKQESQNIAVTTFGILYIPFFMSFYVKMRFLDGGEAMIFLIFLGSKCTDMGAYFTGRALGTTKLIPKISPGKTVEGAVGGMFAGVAVTVLAYYITGLSSMPNFPVTTAVLLGCGISITSTIGDLFESLIKRRYQTKDSAALVPAFGGMLDMIDSILLNGPIIYYIVTISGILEP